MRKFMSTTVRTVDGACLVLRNKFHNFMQKKKEGGFETFVVILLIIAICCGIGSLFKEQLASFIKTIFDQLKGNILTDFTSKPTV